MREVFPSNFRFWHYTTINSHALGPFVDFFFARGGSYFLQISECFSCLIARYEYIVEIVRFIFFETTDSANFFTRFIRCEKLIDIIWERDLVMEFKPLVLSESVVWSSWSVRIRLSFMIKRMKAVNKYLECEKVSEIIFLMG